MSKESSSAFSIEATLIRVPLDVVWVVPSNTDELDAQLAHARRSLMGPVCDVEDLSLLVEQAVAPKRRVPRQKVGMAETLKDSGR
jgi:hypothetical protein